MPKRRHEDDIQYYKKKIRKIERKMKRRQEDDDYSATDRSLSDIADSNSEVEIVAIAYPVDTEITPVTPAISDEVLSALGDLMPDKPKFGQVINGDLARIWSNILKTGLPKESKQKLIEQVLIPKNCPLLKAPKLNQVILATVNDSLVEKDKKIEMEQNQLGLGLSIISNALSLLINNDSVDRLKLISLLSDIGRILTDLHFVQSKSRRNLLYPALDKKFLNIVKEVERDEYIYGSNLSDKIKALKTCQQSGQSITGSDVTSLQ